MPKNRSILRERKIHTIKSNIPTAYLPLMTDNFLLCPVATQKRFCTITGNTVKSGDNNSPWRLSKKIDRFHFFVHNKHTQTVQNSMVSMCRILRKLTNHVTDKNQKRVKRSNKILIVGAQTQSRHSVPNLNVNFSNLHGQINFIYIFLHVPVLLSACIYLLFKEQILVKGF